MAKIRDWQKFAQEMADELGVIVTVGYETKEIDIARAEPRPQAKPKSPA